MHHRHPQSEIGIIQSIITESEYTTESKKRHTVMKLADDPTNTLLPEYETLYTAAEQHGIDLSRQGMHNSKDSARRALIAKYGPGSPVHRAFHRIDLFSRAPNSWSPGSSNTSSTN